MSKVSFATEVPSSHIFCVPIRYYCLNLVEFMLLYTALLSVC